MADWVLSQAEWRITGGHVHWIDETRSVEPVDLEAPVLRGGLFLVVVIGIIVANLRDRLLGWVIPSFGEFEQYDEDPVDYVLTAPA